MPFHYLFIFLKTINVQLSVINNAKNIFKFKRELWVTESIKLPYLSFIRNNKFYMNYFPVEITEYLVGIDGFETKYTLEKLVVK